MFLRILLGVACLSLMTASSAEAQLFRRFLAPRNAQPQRYAPPAGYSQNGYQGRPTASPRRRQMYVRKPDGSVVPYYPANSEQVARNAARNSQLRRNTQQDAARVATREQANSNSDFVTTEGKLEVDQTPAAVQRKIDNVYQRPAASLATSTERAVAPVGVSVMSQPKTETAASSILPATPMPQATAAPAIDPASSIPVSSIATNPAPSGLSLSLTDDVVPASANVPIQSPSVQDSDGQETFSVLETIE